jgi:hypothetical protein
MSKLKGPFRGSSLIPELAFAKKNLLNLQKFNLSLYLRYGPIYRQRGGVKPGLRFLILVDQELLSEF